MIQHGLRFLGVLAVAVVWASACAQSDDFSGSGGGSGGKAGDAGSDAPTTKDDGESCAASTECTSEHCVDGVCCDTACDGACEACDVAGDEGTCSPHAAGSDPDQDCTGGAACEATCDGQGACVSCGLFGCDTAGEACLDVCSSTTDCKDTAWCDAESCVEKIANGGPCTDPDQCKSGTCADGFCCETACDAPNSCSTGTCLCDGVACATDDACTAFYADTDADTFGDPAVFVAACKSAAPANHVENADDCYDKNPSAKPGQKAWFTVERGDGSFDYDCSNAQEKQYPSIGSLVCVVCGGGCPSGCFTAYGCGLPGNVCDSGPNQGFVSEIVCGATGTLNTCADITPGMGCSASTTTATTPQGCH
jgi:hypothetical protein